jgi:hypothetical protein
MVARSDRYSRLRARAKVGALLCLSSGLAVSFQFAALAHGPAPAAVSVVDADAMGPKVVRLTGGYARRLDANRYAYLCPAAWGDDLVLPAGLIPGGPIVVAASRGLYLGDEAGNVKPHPDPAAAKPATDFAQLGGKLYVLRTAGTGSEVLEVDATTVKVVFADESNWTAIAATSSAIGLLRLTADRIEEAQIDAAGIVRSRESAPAPKDPILVIARATTSELYAVVVTATGRELGQIAGDQWKRIELASASIAGPVEVAEGDSFLAVDTELARLSQPEMLISGMAPVNCLGRIGDRAYACTRDGLAAMSPAGVGEPIFALASMTPPDLSKIADPELVSLCSSQWEHFRFDLLALGVDLMEMPAAPPTAGQPAIAGASGAPLPNAGAPSAGGNAAAGAAAGSGGSPMPSGGKRDSGCSVTAIAGTPNGGFGLAGYAVLWSAAAGAFYLSTTRRSRGRRSVRAEKT